VTRLAVAALAAAGPLIWAAWRYWNNGTVIEDYGAGDVFSFTVNPELDEEVDMLDLLALAEFMRNSEVGIGGG
jgi:hypothetical protein